MVTLFSKAVWQCGGLKENVFHRHLNPHLAVGSAVCRGVRGMVLLEELHHLGWA